MADTTPNPRDTRWQVLWKIVRVLWEYKPGALASDAPTSTDTRWQLLRKWNRLKDP